MELTHDTSNTSLNVRSCTDTDTSDARLSTDACQMYLSALQVGTSSKVIAFRNAECRDFPPLALTNVFGGIAEEEGITLT